MSVLGAKNPTLLDVAKSLDPDGSTADVVELLNQTNEILLDATWAEGNLPTGHRVTVRTGLPSVVWRRLYGGVPASKSKRAQVDEIRLCACPEDGLLAIWFAGILPKSLERAKLGLPSKPIMCPSS